MEHKFGVLIRLNRVSYQGDDIRDIYAKRSYTYFVIYSIKF